MECRRGLAMRICPPVRLSVKRVNFAKTMICPDFYTTEWSFSLVFWEEEWWVGSDPFYLKFWVNRPPLSEITDFEAIFARSASAVTPSKKSSINTNRKSPTRFPMSLRWSSYVASKPPKGAQKRKRKIALRLKEVCYKVSLCENCQQQFKVVRRSLA